MKFAIDMFTRPDDFNEYLVPAWRPSAASQVEVLLEAWSGVYSPEVPWDPKYEIRKFFIDNSPNLCATPKKIRLANATSDPRRPEIRFAGSLERGAESLEWGEDALDLRDDYDAVVALLRAAARKNVVLLSDLVKDLDCWPSHQIRWHNGSGNSGADHAMAEYLEIKKRALRNIFHLHRDPPRAVLEKGIEIEIDRATG